MIETSRDHGLYPQLYPNGPGGPGSRQTLFIVSLSRTILHRLRGVDIRSLSTRYSDLSFRLRTQLRESRSVPRHPRRDGTPVAIR